ncbi:hypothetical protein Tco_0762758 [Tanacetum coccineum]
MKLVQFEYVKFLQSSALYVLNRFGEVSYSVVTEDTSSCGSKDLVFVKSLADNSDMSITSSNLHKSSKAEDSTLPNHDTNEKLDGVEPGSGPKTVKSILKSKSMFKAETLKGESSSRSRPSRLSISFPSCIHCGYNNHHSDDCLYYPTCEICGSYDLNISYDHNMIISQRRGINPSKSSTCKKICETCGSNVHTTSDHNDIEWFRKRETPHDKKAESSITLRSKTTTKRLKAIRISVAFAINNPQSFEKQWNPPPSLSQENKPERGGIYGEVGLNTFRNVIGAHYLPHSSEYVAPPSIDVVRKWFPTIGYGEEALKLSQPEEPPFTTYILAICALDKPVVFKAPKTTSRAESVSQGINPRAKTRYKKPTTSSKQPSVSSKEATKGGSSKAPTGSEIGHFKRRKESSSAMDSNPIRPLVSTLVDTKMHKEDQQATGGPTSLGVTRNDASTASTAATDPGNSTPSDFDYRSLTLRLYEQQKVYSLGHDVLADFTTEADPGLSAPNDSIPPQQVLADQTKSISEGLEIVLTQPTIEKGASFTAIHGDKEEASNIIKLEDLAKLVSQIQPSFKDLDSPEDDPNDETEDTSVTRFSSPMSSQTQEMTNQVLILQSQKYKLELKKNKDEAEAALLKAQTSFPNILSSRDFSSSLPTELKDLPSKFNELTEEIKGLKTQVHELEIELPKELKEIPTKLEDFTKTATSLTSHVAELKTLYWRSKCPFLPTEGEKDTNQATISQLFKRRAEKIAEAEKENLNQQPKPTTPPTTTPINPLIITTTTQMKTPLQSPPRSSSQPEGEHIKKDKSKKVMSSEEAEKKSTKSNSIEEAHVTGFMVKSSKVKKLKKFDFVTEDGRHIHLSKEQINNQKKLEEEAKAEAAKQEREVRKVELIDLLGLEVVHNYYNYKLEYDRYCDKMLNRRAKSRITNCDVLTRKALITFKVYIEDVTYKVIPNFKVSDLHLGEWREDPFEKLNDLANKKRKHVDGIHDYFKETKRLKSLVPYGDHLPGTVLNELVLGMIMFNSYHRQDFVTIEDLKDFSNAMLYTVQEIFFRRHQGPGVDNHARTFSSLLLAEVDKRNLNPLKQMRTIEQLRQ